MKRPACAEKPKTCLGKRLTKHSVPGVSVSARQQISDINVSPLFYHRKKRFALKLENLKNLTEKVKHWNSSREEHKLGAMDEPKSPSNVVHLFWDEQGSIANCVEKEAEVHLTSVEQVALMSGVKVGMHMNLWSYHRVVNAPPGVVLRQAADVLPLEDAERFVQAGLRVQHLADVVRLMAVKTFPGSTRTTTQGHLLSESDSECCELKPVQLFA